MMSEPVSHSQTDVVDAIRAAHHQIGNSLQSVASLLTMESRNAPPAAATILSEAGRRVRSVMHLHRRLQESGGDAVRLDELLGDICQDVRGLDARDRNAELRVDIAPIWVNSKSASAVAMITAEWVGNALEHGLANQSGVVSVKLDHLDSLARLTVTDTGVGNAGGDWTPGFGQALVSRLATQLGARVQLSVDATGSRCEILFPIARNTPSSS